MSDPPPPPLTSTSASPQKPQPQSLQLQNSNPNNPLNSPQIPPSPSISDLSGAISSPQIPLDSSSPKPPATPSSPAAAVAAFAAAQQMQRSGSASRLSSQMPYGQAARVYAAAAAGQVGQMSFGSGQVSSQQLAARAAAMMGQGSAAAHFGLQQQLMGQQRQKGLVQGAPFNTSNAGAQALGMQSMGAMGAPLGMNQQIRANGTAMSYAQQQRFAQMRPQQFASQSQTALGSPQKVAGQGLARTSSIAAMNSQLSGSPQNGQTMQMALQQQHQQQQQPQQLLKQMASPMGVAVSPSHPLQQQQQQRNLILLQQLSAAQFQQKAGGLTQHQIAQAQQQHPHLSTQQLQQLHQFQLQQQQQQQQSPRVSGLASQKSMSLTGSQPGTPISGATMTGGTAIQGEVTNQLLGKRKIQDLVAQVDPLGIVDDEVEDFLLEIADDFIDSVTTFACNLAKHRKSSIVEPKDVLLHLERNWNLSVPGFSREDKNHRRNSAKLLMDAQQSESDLANVKSTNKLVSSNSTGNIQLRPTQNTEPLPLPTGGGPHVMAKVHRF